MPKIRKIYSSVWEKWAKKSIFGQKRPNFGQKRPKNRKREFSPKIRNVTNLSFMDAQLHAKKTEKNYSVVLAAEPEPTNGRTNERTHGRRRI